MGSTSAVAHRRYSHNLDTRMREPIISAPRGLLDTARVAERRELLATAEDTLPPEAWAREVEDRRRARLPDIVLPHGDPAETGVRSQVLLLLEAPGPKTVPEWGDSGFISADNDDPMGQNLWRTRGRSDVLTRSPARTRRSRASPVSGNARSRNVGPPRPACRY